MGNGKRRPTPLPYSPEDAERIRLMILEAGAKLVCPPCGKDDRPDHWWGHHRIGLGGALCVLRPESRRYGPPTKATAR